MSTPVNKHTTVYLLAIAFLMSATSASMADSVPAKPELPRMHMMEHQRVALGDHVIYEKDVDLADPNSLGLNVALSVDNLSKNDFTIADHLSVEKTGTEDGKGNLLDGSMITYVVTGVRDGMARVIVVYTLRDRNRAIDKSGYINSVVKLGERYTEVTKDGTKIGVTVAKQQ
jgi:hypothetical protein